MAANDMPKSSINLSRSTVNPALYLVKVQIDALKADTGLEAHRDQPRIWILKLWTLPSLKKAQKKRHNTPTFNHLHLNMQIT